MISVTKPIHRPKLIFSRRYIQGTLLFSLLFFPLYFTMKDYGISSDEPIYMEATYQVKKWLQTGPENWFNKERIEQHWKNDLLRNVHPSGLKWLYLLAQKVVFWEKDNYHQDDILNIFIFCLATLWFLTWWNQGDFKTSIIYIILLLMLPRYFTHIHFPATDIPMTSFFLFLIVFLDKYLFRKQFWIAGLILGFLVSIKITSILLVIPLFLFLLIWYRSKLTRIFSRILIICLLGMIVFYFLNPDWWYDPISRGIEFFTQTLTRKQWTPFTVFFRGRFYFYRGPFYYPFIMFLITTPLLHISLLLIGLFFYFHRKHFRFDRKMTLALICAFFPFLILALPISPANDGIRYLLPAFPFLILFMTNGFLSSYTFLRERSANSLSRTAGRWASALILLAFFSMDLNNPAWFPPFELSYYNCLIGGLKGSLRHGFESTYWWEIINDKAIDRINNLCENSKIYFPISPTDHYFNHMQKVNKILFSPTRDINKAQFVLIFGRPFLSFWEYKIHNILYKKNKMLLPMWGITLDSVPLLKLYKIEDSNG